MRYPKSVAGEEQTKNPDFGEELNIFNFTNVSL
jgi:hypothetical protein